MKFKIVAILFCFCLTAAAQDDRHLKGRLIDINISVLEGKRDTTKTVYLDGYKLNENNITQVANSLIVNKITQIDNVIYIKSKFTYLINNKVYKKNKRNNKLKSLNPNKIVSFDVYSKNEAREIFEIKAKHGLIKILYEQQ